MKMTIQSVTPELAMKMLERNTGNRTVNQDHVLTLAREMSLGRWKLNGSTISINDERLIDGQHRLLAVVKSGVPIETIIVEGLPSGVFDTIDVGKKRTSSDTLSARGETHCKNLAAALAVVDRYVTGRVGKVVRYTNTEIEDLLSKYPEIRRSVRVCTDTKKLVPKSVLTGCHYLFSRKDETDADRFVQHVISGSGITEEDPVYVLRERLLQNSLAKAKLSGDYIMAITIKAWNYGRSATKVRYLRFREEGERPEPFPVVV